jgi:hypothetical protein
MGIDTIIVVSSKQSVSKLPWQMVLIQHTSSILHLSARTEKKMLLKNPTFKKVGNRVHNDVKSLAAWKVDIKGSVELGYVDHDCALCDRAPSLSFLVELLWPGVILEGKMAVGQELEAGMFSRMRKCNMQQKMRMLQLLCTKGWRK